MSFTVYRSSAGSGKTFTLVKEYLKIALSDPQDPPQKYRHILAITFTNKAASEMKERVVRALKDLAEKDQSRLSGSAKTLSGILISELSIPAHELSARAEKVLHAVLHNYSDFAIGTIDGFTHKVIRTFAHDLHLPLNFEIEMDADKLLSEAIDTLMSRIGTDEKLTRALVEFSEQKANDEKNWNIEQDLLKFAGNLLKEEGETNLAQLRKLSADDFFRIRKELSENIHSFESSVMNAAKAAYDLILSKGLSPEAFFQAKSGIAAYFKKLSEGVISYIKPNSYVTKTLGEDKWYSGKASMSEKGRIDEIRSSLTDHFLKIQALYESGYSEYVLHVEINKRIYSLAVLNELEKIISENKKENNILHISEFNRLIANIVMNQPVPFIYERLGEKFSHYLLDEFQDTSLLQWYNLLPLLENSLGENNFNMVVGDGKQSIYRWRGGDVELFSKLPLVSGADTNELLMDRQRSLQGHFRLKQLNRNFRSKREIIAFNNSLFRFAADHFITEPHKDIYRDTEQEADPKNTGGYISLEFLEKGAEEQNDLILSKTLELIRQAREDHFLLREIAVITRNNAEGTFIASGLIAAGIGVISSESLLLKNSEEVNFILNLLRFIDEPLDPVSKSAALQYLLHSKQITGTDLHTLLTELRKHSPISGFTDLLKGYGFGLHASILAKMPLFELCAEIVRIFSLGEKAAAYIQFFLDEILVFSARNPNNIAGFLEWWTDRSEKASVIVPAALDAVNILSIHRSKGLEFPVVILPYANWKMDKGKDELWIRMNGEENTLQTALVPNSKALNETAFAAVYEEENGKAILDNINLLYVALTRPSERMHLITTFPGNYNNLSKIFVEFLSSKELFSPDKLLYEFGERKPRKELPVQKQSAGITLKNIFPQNWRERIKVRQSAQDAWSSEDVTEKRDAGILLHNALARIQDHSQVNTALDAMLNEGLVDTKERVVLENTIHSLLQNPEIKKLFAPGLTIKNESELLMRGGISFRPDRVILDNKKAIVIDYKTGIEKKEHQKQLNGYAGLLTKMGFEEVERYIIYTAESRIEKL